MYRPSQRASRSARPWAVGLAVAGVLAGATACGPGAASQQSPGADGTGGPTSAGARSSTTPSSTRTSARSHTSSATKSTPATIVRHARPDGRRWQVSVPLGQTLADSSTWPDARTLFSTAELRAIFPEATSISVTACKKSSEFYGKPTVKAATCTFVLHEPGVRSFQQPSIEVELDGFGTDAQMTLQWDRVKGPDQRSAQANPGQYVFWKPGSFGAKDAYENFGAVSILLSNGTVAGMIYLNPSNIVLAKNATRNAALVTSQIDPLLIKTLAAKLH